MSIGNLQTEADLKRFVEQLLPRPKAAPFTQERPTDPTPPSEGAIVYCITDNGSGKREIRAQFPTGSPQVIATEP